MTVGDAFDACVKGPPLVVLVSVGNETDVCVKEPPPFVLVLAEAKVSLIADSGVPWGALVPPLAV